MLNLFTTLQLLLFAVFIDHAKELVDSSIVIFNKEVCESIIPDTRVKILRGAEMHQNISTVVVCSKSFQEMSDDELDIIELIARTERTLFVVQFGERNDETLNLLSQFSNCWATTKIEKFDDNTVFICNKYQMKSKISQLLKSENQIFPIEMSHRASNIHFSSFFVSAEKKSNKYRVKKPKIEESEDDIEEIVAKTMESIEKMKLEDDDDDGNEFDNEHDPKRDHRLHCKYRKSCYETGERGLIEPYDFSLHHLIFFWQAPPSQQHHLPLTEDADQDGVPDSENDDIDLVARKYACKYRTSCYKQHEIPLSDKQKERERSFMSAKLQVPQGKKRTLKDIAHKAMHQVEERTDKAKHRPVPNSVIVEKKLQAVEEELTRKLDCKYRKSCYETGEVPEIAEYNLVPTFLQFSEREDSDEEDDEKEFSEMEEDEKKFYCKYRKSCYETGEKPDIQAEIILSSFSDIFEIPEQVETRKLTLQERCKYRKSCYETGVVPDLNRDEEFIEKIAAKEVSKVVPSTVQDLKALCKYRKSCYEEVAVSSTPEIVQTIRKRRLVEKEVRKRKARRHRRMNKRRPDLLEQHILHHARAGEPVEKTQYELRQMAESKEARKKEGVPTAKSFKTQVKESAKKIKKEAKKETKPVEKEEEKEEELAQTVEAQIVDEEPPKKKKSLKKGKQAKSDDDDEKQAKVEKPVKEVEQDEKDADNNDDNENGDKKEEPSKNRKDKLKKKKVDAEEKEAESPKKQEQPKKEEAKEKVKSKKSLKKVKKTVVVTTPAPPVIEENDDDDDKNGNNDPEEPEDKKDEKTTSDDNEEVDEKPEVKIVQKTENDGKKDEKDNDEDDDGNEFDNEHDPKRDHRLHCKYRKSCYETGERGLIEPYDFSLHHLIFFWQAPSSQQHHDFNIRDSDGDGIPDHLDKDTDMANRKLACKYRTSCYETSDIPISEKIIEREEKRTENSPKNDDDDDDDDDKEDKVHSKHTISEEHALLDKKLGCKYRKSCYESGVIPIIQQWNDAPTLTETIASTKQAQTLLGCKYRKSCYREMGINTNSHGEEIIEKEEERKPPIKEPASQAKTEQETSHHHHKHEDRKSHKKHHKKVEKESEEDTDDDDDKDDDDHDEKVKNKKVTQEATHDDDEAIKELQLSVAEKSMCKYRKSCYSGIEPRSTKQDHSGTMARRDGSGQKCHIYYLSCREKMGLPPKEKAPIGPNGKRLCRKKPPQN
ncbi:unnamed protein product [Caenorhabditis bovis]|uniref:Uncharacterized protein n=1 Tax=Caenorhabditis bovis TaxID=2654633 RepID=A0A8S1ETI4_9PELO|nr:unnamed protein product [Caenorhabditis bovis]